jgi:hypothetical protein
VNLFIVDTGMKSMPGVECVQGIKHDLIVFRLFQAVFGCSSALCFVDMCYACCYIPRTQAHKIGILCEFHLAMSPV